MDSMIIKVILTDPKKKDLAPVSSGPVGFRWIAEWCEEDLLLVAKESVVSLPLVAVAKQLELVQGDLASMPDEVNLKTSAASSFSARKDVKRRNSMLSNTADALIFHTLSNEANQEISIYTVEVEKLYSLIAPSA